MTHATCIVTSSASGIGAATVLALAAQGYHAFGIDLNGDGAQNVALQAEVEPPGIRHAAFVADVAEKGIRVNTLSPGATDTPMIAAPVANPVQRQRIEQLAAQKRIGEAAEIASGIVYLLSPQASFTHGANLVIDGGIVL